MNRGRVVLALVILVFLAASLTASVGLPKGARVFPMVALVPGVCLAIWNLANEFRFPHARGKGDENSEVPQKLFQLFAWILSLPLLSWLFGITVGLPVFMFCYLRLASREKWTTTILMTLLAWIAIKFGFDVGMKANFDQGVIWNLFS